MEVMLTDKLAGLFPVRLNDYVDEQRVTQWDGLLLLGYLSFSIPAHATSAALYNGANFLSRNQP